MKHLLKTIKKLIFYIALVPIIDSTASANNEQMNVEIQKAIISAFNSLQQSSVNGYNMFIGLSSDNKGKNETLLTFAAKNNADLVIDFGLSNGSDVNGANSEGETLLSISTKNKNISLMKKALSAGANPNLISGSNETFISELTKSKHPLKNWLLAVDHHAQPRSEEEQHAAFWYVMDLRSFENSENNGDSEDTANYLNIVNYLNNVQLIEKSYKTEKPSIWERQWYEDINKPPYGIHPNMQVWKPNKTSNIDATISKKIESSIDEDTIKNFNINGMNFNQFLF